MGVINQLHKKGARVTAYDPIAMPNTKKLLADTIDYTPDPRSALKDPGCCVIMT